MEDDDLAWIQQTPNDRLLNDRLLNAVKVRLWKLIFSGLLCRPGNIKLSPLDWAETSFSREPEGQHALEQGNHIFSNNAHLYSTTAEEDLLFEHHSLASKNVESDLFESNLFDFENAGLDDEDLFFAEDGMLDLGLQDECEDEDLFWEDGYETTPTLTNNSGDAVFNFENIVLLSDDDENLLLDGDENITSKTHGQRNPKIISSGNHEAYDDDLLLIEI